jgi:trigger factor
MDIKEIKKDILFKKYKVSLPKEDMAAAVENKAQEIAKTAQIPGFRVGKVPLNMIKSRYKDDIKSGLMNNFIESAVDKIVKENKFELAERPALNKVDFKDEGEFVFEVDFHLLPKMPEIDFSKIKLIKPAAQVSEKDVKEALEELQKRNVVLNLVHKDIPIEAGYVALIDAIGYMDGKEFSEGKVTNHKLKIGSKQFMPGFEDGLVGVRTGEEKTLKLKFPADYHSQKCAGKDVTFVVKVKEVFKEELPKLDDEFAKKFNLKSLAELRETAKKSAQERLDQLTKTILKKELFDILSKDIKVELPAKLLQRELEFVNKAAAQDEASQQPKKVTTSKAKKTTSKVETKITKVGDKNKEIAERRIKLGLFVNDLARKEGITLSQQDISNEVMAQLKANPESASFLIKYYKENPQALEPLRGKALEDKVVSFILSKVDTQQKNVTAEELKMLHNKTS